MVQCDNMIVEAAKGREEALFVHCPSAVIEWDAMPYVIIGETPGAEVTPTIVLFWSVIMKMKRDSKQTNNLEQQPKTNGPDEEDSVANAIIRVTIVSAIQHHILR